MEQSGQRKSSIRRLPMSALWCWLFWVIIAVSSRRLGKQRLKPVFAMRKVQSRRACPRHTHVPWLIYWRQRPPNHSLDLWHHQSSRSTDSSHRKRYHSLVSYLANRHLPLSFQYGRMRGQNERTYRIGWQFWKTCTWLSKQPSEISVAENWFLNSTDDFISRSLYAHQPLIPLTRCGRNNLSGVFSHIHLGMNEDSSQSSDGTFGWLR